MQQPDAVQEKLLPAFAGYYGLYISLHFRRFLREPLRTPAQRAAYAKIIASLDSVPARIPAELNEFLEQAIRLKENLDIRQYEDAVQLLMEEVLRDPDACLLQLDVEGYLAYRTSEEFRQSPPGKMATLLREFQQNSGYREVFLPNLMALSPAYRDYVQRLEAANAIFLERYPQAGAIYGVE